MSQYDPYSNAVENFQQFGDAVGEAKNMRQQNIGEAILALAVPVLTKASEKSIGSWMTKWKNNKKVRGQQEEEDEPEGEEAPAADEAVPAAETTQEFANPAFNPETLFQGQEPGGEALYTGEYEGGEAVRAGALQGVEESVITQPSAAELAYGASGTRVGATLAQPSEVSGAISGDTTLARALGTSQAQVEATVAPQLEGAASQAGTTAAAMDVNVGDLAATAGEAAGDAVGGAVAAAGEAVTGTLGTLALDTSWMPEISTVFAVGALVSSAVVGMLDLFKHHSIPDPLENLPQVGI